jgi:hypothetical protein
MTPPFEDRLELRDQPLPRSLRHWRPASRVALAAWAAVVAGIVVAFALGAPRVVAWLAAALAAAGVYALPLAAWRREPVLLEADPHGLRIRQGPRRLAVSRDEMRSVHVGATATERTQPAGWGRFWSTSGRLMWEIPEPGLGVVRIRRTRLRPDLDVATHDPHGLVDALLCGEPPTDDDEPASDALAAAPSSLPR